MKAAFIEQFGGPDVIRFGDLPDPRPSEGEALVAVEAASRNRADYLVRAGAYPGNAGFPLILGRDFAGSVLTVPDGASGLRVGARVFGVLDVGREGAYAQQVAVAASIIAPLPDELSARDAAALALAGLTAVVTIEETLRIRTGETILIQGGAGGVAGVAIQIAKHAGAHVISTASAANLDYVRSLGADEVIDYAVIDFTSIGPRCDAVFDTVGGDVALRAFDVLKAGGRAAFIASGASPPPAPREDLRSLRPKVARSRGRLERVLELVRDGAVTVPPLTVFPLADARLAHEAGEARHGRGKTVLEVQQSYT